MTERITAADALPGETVKVWDGVVRAFHWSTVALFALAYLFEDPRVLHEVLGYALMAVLAVRLCWGFIGPRRARFADFVPTPSRFRSYVGDVLRGRERRYLGHNPAGGAMVVALMVSLIAIGVSGWMMGLDRYWGEDWVEDLHEGAVSAALILVALHILGVAYASVRHRENLVRAMVSGLKRRM